MGRQLSALDREKKRILADSESRAALALRQHRKMCGDCHREETWPRNACAEGWELAKAAHRAANNLNVFLAGAPDDELAGQETLW